MTTYIVYVYDYLYINTYTCRVQKNYLNHLIFVCLKKGTGTYATPSSPYHINVHMMILLPWIMHVCICRIMRAFVLLALALCAVRTSAENAYTVNGNTVYCPDSCSIRGPTVISSGKVSMDELLQNCTCVCDGVQSACSEKKIATSHSAVRQTGVFAGGLVAGIWLLGLIF